MKSALFLFLAAATIRFDVTDSRGKKPSGVSITAGAPDIDGWSDLRVESKSKSSFTIVWPFDAKAKEPDGPGAVPVVVVGDEQTKKPDPKIAAYRVAARLLSASAGPAPPPAHTGIEESGMEESNDPFVKGVWLLEQNRFADAIEPLDRALKERERQLTRVPSEIYPAAMLYGKALFGARKFDDAAVAFLKALNLRPSDPAPRHARSEALIKAGKPEAAQGLIRR